MFTVFNSIGDLLKGQDIRWNLLFKLFYLLQWR